MRISEKSLLDKWRLASTQSPFVAHPKVHPAKKQGNHDQVLYLPDDSISLVTIKGRVELAHVYMTAGRAWIMTTEALFFAYLLVEWSVEHGW